MFDSRYKVAKTLYRRGHYKAVQATLNTHAGFWGTIWDIFKEWGTRTLKNLQIWDTYAENIAEDLGAYDPAKVPDYEAAKGTLQEVIDEIVNEQIGPKMKELKTRKMKQRLTPELVDQFAEQVSKKVLRQLSWKVYQEFTSSSVGGGEEMPQEAWDRIFDKKEVEQQVKERLQRMAEVLEYDTERSDKEKPDKKEDKSQQITRDMVKKELKKYIDHGVRAGRADTPEEAAQILKRAADKQGIDRLFEEWSGKWKEALEQHGTDILDELS